MEPTTLVLWTSLKSLNGLALPEHGTGAQQVGGTTVLSATLFH